MYSPIPTDVIRDNQLDYLSFPELLNFRLRNRQSNAMVLEFLKGVWLPRMYGRLKALLEKIKYNYLYLLEVDINLTLRSPNLREEQKAAQELQKELTNGLTLIRDMLHAMTILKLNYSTIKDSDDRPIKISQEELRIWQQRLKDYQAKTETLLGRIVDMIRRRETEMEFSMHEIEHMAGSGRGRRQMTADQKAQIMAAINDCLASREHTSGARGSTLGTHQAGMARRKADKWNRAQRIFQTSGFTAALNDARRC